MSKKHICILTSMMIIVLGYTQMPEWTYSANAPMLSSLTFADFVGDSVEEVIAATYAPPPNQYDYGVIYVLDIDGNTPTGWPKQLNTGPIPATPAIGDIDGDGIPELVVGNWSELFILRADGTSYPGWPQSYGTFESAVLEDMDGDGDLEIIYASGANLYVFQEDGTIMSGFPVSVPHDNVGTPSVADIDGDSLHEIVAGIKRGPIIPGQFELYAWNSDGSIVAGFPVWLCGVIKATPALGDLDNDGANEIVINAYYSTNGNDSIYVIDGAGNMKPGWPIGLRYCRMSSPALGDLDKDGDLEIIVGGGSGPRKLFAFHYDGTNFPNWPVALPGGLSINSSPVIADIDGDTSQVEILIKAQDYICGFHADASVVSGFPYYISDQSHSGTYAPSPVIGDMDKDGDVEYALASFFGEIHFFDEAQSYYPEFAEWPMYKHDQRNTGFYPREGPGGVKSNPGEHPVLIGEVSLQNIYPNPFSTTCDIKYSVAACTQVKLQIYDAVGKLVRTLFNEEKQVGCYTMIWDGKDDQQRYLPGGVYFCQFKDHDFIQTAKVILVE
jgi:hypothetical protein